ncbi:uncharacterized protein LOC144445252 [Glandiceps talaboti]
MADQGLQPGEPEPKRSRFDPFMETLANLSREITPEEFEHMKILFEERLPVGALERMVIPGNLFIKLYRMNYIKESNTSLLEEVLCKIGRQQLVEKYLKKGRRYHQGTGEEQRETDLPTTKDSTVETPACESSNSHRPLVYQNPYNIQQQPNQTLFTGHQCDILQRHTGFHQPLPQPPESHHQPLFVAIGSHQPLPVATGSNQPLPVSTGSHQPLSVATGSNQPLPVSTGSHQPLPVSTGSHQPLPQLGLTNHYLYQLGLTNHYLYQLGLTNHYLYQLGITNHYLYQLGLTNNCLNQLGLTNYYLYQLGLTNHYLYQLVSTGSHQPLPVSTGSHKPLPVATGSNQPLPETTRSQQSLSQPIGSQQPLLVATGSYQPLPESTGSHQPLPVSTGSHQPLPVAIGSHQPLPVAIGSHQPLPVSTGSHQPLPVSTGSHQSLPVSTGSHQPLPVSTGSHHPLPQPIGSQQPLLVATGSYQPLPESTGYHQSLAEAARYYRLLFAPTMSNQSLPESTWYHQSLPESTGYHQSLPESTGYHQSLPESTGYHQSLPQTTCHYQAHPEPSRSHQTLSGPARSCQPIDEKTTSSVYQNSRSSQQHDTMAAQYQESHSSASRPESSGNVTFSQTTRHPDDVSDSEVQLIKVLKRKYIKYFRNHKPIPWNEKCNLNLEDVYTQLEVKDVTKGKFKVGDILEDVSDIFKSVSEGPDSTNRIRIEGAPAIGKSTLCGKIAYEWAQGRLDKYKLVFFLKMRYVTGYSISDEIQNQLLFEDKNIPKERLEEIISTNESSVLFLLDGLDEIRKNKLKQTEIPKVISEERLSTSTAVVTSRPRECDKYVSECDLHFDVKGFTDERMKEYIKKYFQGSEESTTGEDFMKEIIKQKRVNRKVFKRGLLANPLHVSFLCILWEDKHVGAKFKFPKTLPGLYREILNCILRRYCNKNNIELKDGILPKEVINAKGNLISDSCKLYMQGESMFNKADISLDMSLELGLLVRDEGPRTEVQELYFFYHKTWLEYFTALHLACEAKNRNFAFLDNILIDPETHLSVWKFLAGIMEKQEMCHLFEEFSLRVQSLSQFNSSFDAKKANTLSKLWSVCLLCLYESKWGEDCISHISPLLHARLVYRGKDKLKSYVYYDNLLDVNYPVVRVYSSICSIDCIVHLIKLLQKIQSVNSTTNTVESLIIAGVTPHQVSLLSTKLKESRISLSVVISVMSVRADELKHYNIKNTIHYVGQMPKMIKQSEFSDISIHVLCGKEKPDCNDEEVKKSMQSIKESICQSQSIQSLTYSVYADHVCELSTIVSKQLIQNGPSRVTLQYRGELSDNVQERLCEFIHKCQTTHTVELNLETRTQSLIPKLTESLKCPSDSLKSFTLTSYRVFDTDNDILDVLSTNTTLTEIGIGELPSKAVHSVCKFIKHNRCVKSLSVDFKEYNSEMWDPIKEALEQNKIIQYLTLSSCRYYSYDHSILHPWILGAVQCLFPSVIRSVETNQCTLKSITFYTKSHHVHDEKVTEIQDIIASQQKPTDWSYEYNVTPFLDLYDDRIRYKHTVQFSVQDITTKHSEC